MKSTDADLQLRLDNLKITFSAQQFVVALEAAISLCRSCNYTLEDGLLGAKRRSMQTRVLLEALVLLGRTYARRGFLLRATKTLEDAVQLGKQLEEAGELVVVTDSLVEFDGSKHKADAHRFLGQLYAESARLAEAETHYQHAITAYDSAGLVADKAMCNGDLIWRHLRKSDFSGAREHGNACLIEFDALGLLIDKSRMLNQLGTIDNVVGDLPAALEKFQLALELATSAGSIRDRIVARMSTGVALVRATRFVEGLAVLQDAMAEAEDFGCELLIAQVCHQIGYHHTRTSRFSEALGCFDHEQRLLLELEREFEWSRCIMSMASVYTSLSEYDRAIELVMLALSTQERLNQTEALPGGYLELGDLNYYLKDYARSLEYYQMAMSQAVRLGNKRIIGTCEGNIGIALLDLGRHSEALVHMHRAIEQYEAMNIQSEVARHRMNAGVAWLNSGELVKAHEYLSASDPVFEKHGMERERANARMNLGRVYSNKAFPGYDAATAEHYLMDCVRINTELGVKQNRFRAHSYLADLYYQEQRWPEFADQYQLYHHLEREVLNERALATAHKFEQKRVMLELERQRELDQIHIKSQTRELETAVKELVRKNEFLSHVKKQTEALTEFVRGEGLNLLEQLTQRVDRNLIAIDDMRDLREQWDVVHEEYLHLLRTKVPSLTDAELKISALLKMKLTSTNIASILFVSKRTVEYHRLNIRKKLGLDEKTDLAVYFNTLK